MAAALLLPDVNRIKARYKIQDQAFFDALLEIKPTVFFGQMDRNEPQQGEKLLTQ
jgi:hypothetical protein